MVWHYLKMKSRVLLTLALVSTSFLIIAPAAKADETTTATPAISAPPAPPKPDPNGQENDQQHSEKGEKPHLGEDAPGRQRNGDEEFREHGIFDDVDALFALAGAFVLGGGRAVVIQRRKKRDEI